MRFKDQQPDRRSYHSSFIFDRKLYVYGGLDIREGSLASLYELNLQCLNELSEEEGDSQFISRHKWRLV